MGQACALDLNQVWRVTPVSTLSADTNKGTTWDDLGGSAPDPYVVMGLLKTPEVADSCTPA